MPRDVDREAELRREAMDRLIAASTSDAAIREAMMPTRGVAPIVTPIRTASTDGNISA
jgi:hypothetical protein